MRLSFRRQSRTVPTILIALAMMSNLAALAFGLMPAAAGLALLGFGTLLLAALALLPAASAPVPEAVEAEALQARLGYRADLLDLMTSSEPRSVVLVDKWERILFANREAARRSGRDSESLIGSTLAALQSSPEAGELTRRRLRDSLRTRAPVIHVDGSPTSFSPRIVQTSFVPVPDTRHIRDAVLITETDITGVVTERDRREKMLRQVLDVCVAVVDRRDPHAAGHSALVGELAGRLAGVLNLPGADIETAEIAGLLMNFGKVLVPQSILTKRGALTAEELILVRHSMMSSADVLSIIQFDLPVVETLRQLYERHDGSGLPEGRRGDDIIVTARICALVNVFVALISSRAHRAGLPVGQALEILRKDAGTAYDPKLIGALEQLTRTPDLAARFAGASPAAALSAAAADAAASAAI